jgi:hypothetical protein
MLFSVGSHTILVRATNERGATGEAGININVVSASAAAPGATNADFVSAKNVSLQNGQIRSNTTYKGLASKMVNGTIIVASNRRRLPMG